MTRRVLTPLLPVVVIGCLVVAYVVAISSAKEPQRIRATQHQDVPYAEPAEPLAAVAYPVPHAAARSGDAPAFVQEEVLYDEPAHVPAYRPAAPKGGATDSATTTGEPGWVVNPYATATNPYGDTAVWATSSDSSTAVAPQSDRRACAITGEACCASAVQCMTDGVCYVRAAMAKEHPACSTQAVAGKPATCCPAAHVGSKVAARCRDASDHHHHVWEALAGWQEKCAALEAREKVRNEMLPMLMNAAVKNAQLEARLAVADQNREAWESLADQMVENARLEAKLEAAEAQHEFYGELMGLHEEFVGRVAALTSDRESLSRQLEVERRRNEQMAARIQHLEQQVAAMHSHATNKVARKPAESDPVKE